LDAERSEGPGGVRLPSSGGLGLVSHKHFEPLTGGRVRIDWGITALMVAVFFVGIFWFTHGNGYPSFYHPEEELRANQLIMGAWDLHHPLLSAVTTKLLKKLLHVPNDLQAVVQLGRTVSAFFAVGSIICLALAVYFLGNPAVAGLLSFLLLCQHQFFDLAHTMSENSTLMFGSSLTLLAIVLLEEKATVPRSLLLGVSVAIAVSAKYIGALLFIPALIAILRSGGREYRVNRVVEFVLGLLFALLVVNFYAVTELRLTALDLLQDLGSAFASTPNGFKNLVHGTYWLSLWHNMTPAIWVMLAISLSVLWIRRRNLKLSEILLVVIPLIYFLLLLFAPSGDLRFLPVVGFTYAFAVAGVGWMAELISSAREEVRGWLLPALLAVCVAACFFEFLRGYPYYAAFNWDERVEMLTWMDGNLRPGSKVIADPSVLLPKLLEKTKQKYRFDLLMDAFPKVRNGQAQFQQIAAAGADYVVVSESDYKSILSSAVSVAMVNDESIGAVKQFYSELFKKGTLVWSRGQGPVPYLQPGLEIYHLPKSGDGPQAARDTAPAEIGTP
jgi:Dolichyl-phosphate-mannose-protein mannosyltransferase